MFTYTLQYSMIVLGGDLNKDKVILLGTKCRGVVDKGVEEKWKSYNAEVSSEALQNLYTFL